MAHRLPRSRPLRGFKPFTSGASAAARMQAELAAPRGISMETLQNWEQGRRRPQGAAVALICIVARDPWVLRRSLSSSPAT